MKYTFLSILNDIWYNYCRELMALVFYITSVVFWYIGIKSKARALCCASIRYGLTSKSTIHLKKILLKFPYAKENSTKGVLHGEAAGRTIVIKWPLFEGNDCLAKGVLIITFTRTFSYFLRNIDLEALEKYFHIVLEPSWSGYADPDILAFMGRVKKIIVQSSEVQDRALLNCFPDTFVAASFGASDWVDTKIFFPSSQKKKYDSIYIANTNPIKRVKRYLDAIKNIVDSGNNHYVGCLVCASWGGAKELIAAMVNRYNLGSNVVLKFDLSTESVIENLNQSKINILLSYKEGSNRSLFESMFCGTPVICIYENVGVNKAYINEYTGLLVLDANLEMALLWASKNYFSFDARKWAVDNIAPVKTTEKLYKLIASRLENNANPVLIENKILIKTNNPEVSYFDFPKIKVKDYSGSLLNIFKIDAVADVVPTLKELTRNFHNEFTSHE